MTRDIKTKYSTKKIIIVLIIAVVILVIAAFGVTKAVSNLIIEDNIGTIKEMALHDASSVNNSINLRYEALEHVEDVLKKKKPSEFHEMLNILSEELGGIPGAKELSLVEDEGNVYKNTGLISNQPEIREICDKNPGKFIVRYNREDVMLEMRSEVMLVGVPVDLNVQGKHFTHIIATMNMETLISELKIDSYGGQGFCSIIDTEGNYIVNVDKNHSFLTLDNFFKDMEGATIKKHGSIEEILKGADESQYGSDVAKLDGKEIIIVVNAMPDEKWYQVTTVPISVFKKQTGNIMAVIYVLLAAFIVIAAVIVVILLRQRGQKAQMALVEERAKNIGIIEEKNKQLEDQSHELEDALEQAEAASNAKTTFLFNMSHDIRTPMNAIIGFNNMAINHIDDRDKVEDCLNKVNSSSKHLLNLINDILDMARIESGKEKSDLELTSVSAIVKEIVDMQKESSPKDLEYETNFEGIEHDTVTTDRLHTSRIIANIVSNAVKYTPEGGKIIVTINESTSEKEGCMGYDFIVQDTGIGMSEEFLEHIFEEFSREKSSTHSGVQGTGLGMAITKHLVDLLDGTINIESELGKGTKVTVHLDMAPAEEEEEEEEGAFSYLDHSLIKGKKILLVEDNELNREIAMDILEEYGLIVETAENGEIAVEKCRKAIEGGRENYHDLIFMDIQMPVMDGYEATKVIRSLVREGERRVPIVAMTANAFAEDRQKALNCGMQDHIAKPIDISELERVLKTYIK